MISSISCTMFGLMLAGSSSEISGGSPIASYCCWSPLIEPADCWSRCANGKAPCGEGIRRPLAAYNVVAAVS